MQSISLDLQQLDNTNDNLASSSFLKLFQSVSTYEVADLISKAPVKSCPLDPVPTGLLRECIREGTTSSRPLLSMITSVINRSLSEGIPTAFKTAFVSPLLKKYSLDKEVFKNYRPISNLAFLSQLIEKVV